MALLSIFDVAGTAMSAQSLRLNVTASNMANAGTEANTAEQSYKARQPVFKALPLLGSAATSVGVQLLGVVEHQAPPNTRHAPGHPLADANDVVYGSNVNPIEELVNMISASRSYQNSVEVVNTSKQLLMRTLSLGEN